MSDSRTHAELVEVFSQSVGVEKAEDLVASAAENAGLSTSGEYSTEDAVYLCELIQEQQQGYLAELAIDTRVRIEADGQFNTLFEHLPHPIARLGYEGGIPIVRRVNTAFEDTFGCSVEDVVGEPYLPLFSGSAREQLEEIDEKLQQTESSNSEIEVEIDGETRYFRVEATPDTTESTELQAFVSFSDHTESKRREQTLEQREKELEESNKELEQFAYIASHDLQEPLRMVSSYLQLLEMEYGDELGADADEYIEYAVDGADRMKGLIDGLLAFSRVETDGREPEVLNANVVLDGVRDDLQMRIQENNATLNIEGGMPEICVDESQASQLFQNLIKNAIKYTREGVPPEVSIRAEREGAMVAFEVEDNGQGIPEDEQEKIFEVFTRGEDEDDGSGTGIGLAISKRIVEGHGGEMSVESTVGEGSTFRFTLPAGDA